MSAVLPAPSLRVEVEPLCQSTFSPFGTVIENPSCSGSGFQQQISSFNLQAVRANQGTAMKYSHVSHMYDFYDYAPSQRKGAPVMNMFVCAPRCLRAANLDRSGPGVSQETTEGLFDVEILERHPFTTQTFIPLGLSATDPTTRYLVIVAPTLPSSCPCGEAQRSVATPSRVPGLWDLPSPAFPLREKCQVEPQRGMPDLHKIRAFLAHGSQAVTYGAGTWHAPMAVVGKKKVTFVVTQFANSINTEDCEEIEIRSERFIDCKGVVVSVPKLDYLKPRLLKI